MMYYIEDPDGTVVAKFDGVDVDVRDGDEIVEVDSTSELSDVTANWIEQYLEQ